VVEGRRHCSWVWGGLLVMWKLEGERRSLNGERWKVVLWYLTYNFCALSATYFSMRSMFVAESLLSSLQVGVDDFQSW
jgi:hypothetical protein